MLVRHSPPSDRLQGVCPQQLRGASSGQVHHKDKGKQAQGPVGGSLASMYGRLRDASLVFAAVCEKNVVTRSTMIVCSAGGHGPRCP